MGSLLKGTGSHSLNGAHRPRHGRNRVLQLMFKSRLQLTFTGPAAISTLRSASFEGQSDIGSAVGAGQCQLRRRARKRTRSTPPATTSGTTRDEFRYLWKKMSGDVSLAADMAYPDPNGYGRSQGGARYPAGSRGTTPRKPSLRCTALA